MNAYQKLRHDLRSTISLINQLKHFLNEERPDAEMKGLFLETMTKQVKCLEEQYNTVVELENQIRTDK